MAGVTRVCDSGSVREQEEIDVVRALGLIAVCETCGYTRLEDHISDCLVCKLKSEKVALTLELTELKEEVRNLKDVVERTSENVVLTLELGEEVKRLSHVVEGVRQDTSARLKVMSEGSKKSWPVGESRIESQAGKEDSDRCQTGKGERNRS